MKKFLLALFVFATTLSFAQMPLDIISFEAEYVSEANVAFELQVANVVGVNYVELQLGSNVWNLQGRYRAFPLEQSDIQVIRRTVNVGPTYNYARIRVDNIDGTSDYSDLIAFETERQTRTFVVVPGGIVALSGDDVEVTDMDGRTYFGRTDEFLALPPGAYTIRVNRESFKFVIAQ